MKGDNGGQTGEVDRVMNNVLLIMSVDMLHTKKNAYRDSNHKCMFWKGKSNLLTVVGIETWASQSQI